MKYCLFALFLLITHLLQAQQFTFSHYKLDKGLPANKLMQDSKGYLWIGSDGLFRFDGTDAVHFSNDPKTAASLVNNNIRSICEDIDGTIWIGSVNGISKYNPFTNQFTNYSHQENDSTSLVTNRDNFVFIDEDGTVWAGNREGISRFNKKKHGFTHYRLAPYQQAGRTRGSFISFIINDKTSTGWLWLASYDGLIHFRKKDGFAVYYYPGNKPLLLNRLYMDSHNRLWICSWGKGIGTFNIQTGKFSFNMFEQDQQLGTSNIVLDIKEKPVNAVNSIFYLSTGIGFTSFTLDTVIDISHLRLQNFMVNNPSRGSSIGGLPHDILVDRQGIVWIATDKDISYILPNTQAFANYHIPGAALGNINTITENKDENGSSNYWVCSWYANGLVRCNADFTHAERVNYFDKLLHSRDGSQINQALPVGSRLWVATMNGLFLYDRKTKNKKAFYSNMPGISLPSDKIVSLCADKLNRLWIGTYNNGLALLDLNTQKSISPGRELLQQCIGKKVGEIYEDSKGFIWVTSSDDLLKINETSFQYTVYRHNAADSGSKAGSEPTGFAEDKRHRLWISSHEGLNMYDAAKDNFRLFTTANGLSNNNIQSIACDSNGYIWIAAAKGLNRLDPDNFHIKSYYNEDGIEEDNNLNYLLSGSKGQMIIGGSNLLTCFYPAHLIKNKSAPAVYINGITVNNKEKMFTINGGNKKIELNYNENYFTIDFIALNLIDATQNKYAYKLEGLDDDFIQAGNAHKAVYTNVGPGTYTFKVKAANNDDVWNEEGASVIITIRPPFWKTKWFIALMSVSLLLLIILIVRYVSQRNLKEQLLQLEKEQAIEKERNRISRDMHDDLGSGLTKIAIMSEVVKQQLHDAGKARQQLENISGTSRELVDNLQDIIWVLNPQNDTLDSLAAYIREYALKFFEPFAISVHFNYPEKFPELKLSEEKRRNIFLVAKEFFTNTAKHAGCSHVTITINAGTSSLTLVIKDDGKGFDRDKVRLFGNGLANMQNRITQAGGSFSLQTNPGSGTALSVTIPV